MGWVWVQQKNNHLEKIKTIGHLHLTLLYLLEFFFSFHHGSTPLPSPRQLLLPPSSPSPLVFTTLPLLVSLCTLLFRPAHPTQSPPLQHLVRAPVCPWLSLHVTVIGHHDTSGSPFHRVVDHALQHAQRYAPAKGTAVVAAASGAAESRLSASTGR